MNGQTSYTWWGSIFIQYL